MLYFEDFPPGHVAEYGPRVVTREEIVEFAAEFEQACQQRGLHLFVLPPRSPKLNGAVERANRTHTEEFYQVMPCPLEMKKLNRELRHWEKIYNTVRPHQALGYLTPLQFLRLNSSQWKE